MKKLISIFFLIYSIESYGQVKILEISDSFWYNNQQNTYIKAKLSDLRICSDSLHFRFSTEKQAIDIYTNDYILFNGTFTNYTTSSPCTNCMIKRKKKFYSRKYNLDTAIARSIYDIFKKFSIFNIPTCDSIPGWSKGLDGEEFLIEYSTPSKYIFKGYWTPGYYKNVLKEAKIICALTNELEEKLNMHTTFYSFIDQLPVGCYHDGGGLIVCTTFNPGYHP